MTPERWARLEPLIDAALDLAADQHAAFYERVASSHPDLRADLERLLGWAGDDRGLFTAAAAERFALLFDDEAVRQPPPDILAQLQASLGAAYSLERELGGAGMSRVFLARESELGRRVVIKVLPLELASGINAERFDREIKLAATLQQANIVPLLATGRAAGYAYYTMPFVEGRSLRDRLAREAVIPIGDAVNLLRDVARALAYAHTQGVVHRDIKPGNVLLSGGTAVVTDFGIAKALTAARGGGGLEAISHGGPGIGTPPYMAPEQAAGDPAVDHRADIYAFGCLAYEVFTGKPPFHGHAPHIIIAAHFHEVPRPLAERRRDVPPAIAALIAQCLEKNPARRPQSAAHLLEALDAVPSQPKNLGRRWPTYAVKRGALALTAVVLGAAAYLVYRSARTDGDTTPPLTLAAIPFRNLSREPALEYRADGISDEILTVMSKVPGVRIVGRDAGRRYKDRDIDERAAQRELGAVFLMTGTYQERGGRSIVSAHLSDSTTRGELWAATFEIASADFRSLPDSIARVVTGQLHARYASRIGEPKRGAVGAVTTNPEAYEDYLDGQFLLRRRGPGIMESVKRFEAAIRLDPECASAYGALATALTFYPWFYGTPHGEVRDSVLNTARRALAIDSTVAKAHSAMAMVYASNGQWDMSTRHFRHALALDPDDFDTHVDYGRLSTIRGDLTEARRQFEQAKTIEHTSPLLFAWSAYVHFLNGEAELARAESWRAFRLDSTRSAVTNLGALIFIATNSPEEARRLAVRQPPLPMTTAPYVFAKLKDTATALRLVRAMESTNPRPWVADVQRASVLLAIGDGAGALSALEQSRTAGPMWIAVIPPCDPAWDLVRTSQRFRSLVRQAKLDERSLTVLRGCHAAVPTSAPTVLRPLP
jgi:eukaryotic-like serine/threonine-protein kinase